MDEKYNLVNPKIDTSLPIPDLFFHIIFYQLSEKLKHNFDNFINQINISQQYGYFLKENDPINKSMYHEFFYYLLREKKISLNSKEQLLESIFIDMKG